MPVRPDWADAEVLRVCRPELHDRCDWPECRTLAVYEVEFDVDGEWAAHVLCPAHRGAVGTAGAA